jgi:oligopeptide/dipeptide ABC transporter ATP-binding protein
VSASDPGGELVAVDGLTVSFSTRSGVVRAVDDVSLRLRRREIVGLVGESASGKSTLGKALMRMIPDPGRITAGSVRFDGRDVLAMSPAEMRELRGARISAVTQDALAVMNPVTTVGEQIGEVVRDHRGGTRAAIHDRVIDAMGQVGLPTPALNARRYAHELSGGMQQRVVIAEALILDPELIIADEPTTALDVTVQAQILALLRRARDQLGASVLFITHDLAVVAELCDRVLVMYAGRIVESGSVREIFRDPQHPYTRALLSGVLPLHGPAPASLDALRGQPPRPEEWPHGCRFHPRCPLYAELGDPRCERDEPAAHGAGHWAACHFAASGGADDARA